MPGCKPGDLARIVGGHPKGALCYVDGYASIHETGPILWPRSRCWFIVTLLQPPPSRDALGDPWRHDKLTIAPDEKLIPIRPGDIARVDARDKLVDIEWAIEDTAVHEGH